MAEANTPQDLKVIEDAFYPAPKEEEPKVETPAAVEAPEKVETKVEEAKPEEVPGEAKKEEVEYKLELSKETFLDNSILEDVKAFAKENNLSNEAAQKLLSKQDDIISKFVEAEKNGHDKKVETWREEIISDPVYGGDNLKKMSENAKRVVEKFGSENFKELLRDTGYGDNPEVFKFIAKIGSLMDNDSLVLSGSQGHTKSIEEVFYGKNN